MRFFWLATFALASRCAFAADGVSAPAMRVLRDECVGCHKPGKAKGGLLLTTREKVLKGGDSGAGFVPGKAKESLIWQLLLSEGDPHMPPKKQLAPEQIAAIAAWVDAGAVWDAAVFDELPKVKPVALKPPAGARPVLALALSPDQKRLAIAGGPVVVIRDFAQAQRPVSHRLEGGVEAVQSLAWSPDGARLASGGFRSITLWDASAGKTLGKIEGAFVGQITALAFSPDGTKLFAADGEPGVSGFIHEIAVSEKRHVTTWKAHDDTIYALQIAPGKSWLASASADKLARLWNLADRKLIGGFEGHTNHVLSLAFNADATQLATSGADRELKIWDVASRSQVLGLGDKKRVFGSVAWSRDGKTLAAVTDKGAGTRFTELKLYEGTERSGGAREQRLGTAGQTIYCAAITADGKTICAGAHDGSVQMWDEAGKLLPALAP